MQITDCRFNNRNRNGFTIIELLLVIIIAGAILAVVVPRAYRANVESKYTLLRQVCTELASNANKWSEQQVDLQPASIGGSPVTSDLGNYIESLAGGSGNPQSPVWIADAAVSNWNAVAQNIVGRQGTAPTSSVSQIMSVGKTPRNPFNGASVFVNVNDPSASGLTPGAIACAWDDDASTTPNTRYFALIFQGNDSTTTGTTGSGAATTFHAGQDNTISGLRNGVYINSLP